MVDLEPARHGFTTVEEMAMASPAASDDQLLELLKELRPRLEAPSFDLMQDLDPCKTSRLNQDRREVKLNLSGSGACLTKLVTRVCAEFRPQLEKVVSARVLPAEEVLDGLARHDHDAEVRHVALLLVLAFVACCVPDLYSLAIRDLPASAKSAEQALRVLCAAFLSQGCDATVRILSLSVRGFGTEEGCEYLSQLLESPDCKLEVLFLNGHERVWDPGMSASGTTGMSASGTKRIAQALKRNKSLIKFYIDMCPVGDEGLRYLAKMLSTNSNLQLLGLHGIDMTEAGLRHLCNTLSLSERTSLTQLVLSSNRGMGPQAAEVLGEMLAKNKSLKGMDVSLCDLEDGSGVFAQGLQKNRTLEKLNIGHNKLAKVELERIFDSVAANNTLKKLLASEAGGNVLPEAKHLAAMIKSTGSLVKLDVSRAPYSEADWAGTLLPALFINKTLRSVKMIECEGVQGGDVLAALLDLVRQNKVIQKIGLVGTPLAKQGRAQDVLDELHRNRQFQRDWSKIRKSTLHRKSCTIILYGSQDSGQTSLLQSMAKCAGVNIDIGGPPSDCSHIQEKNRARRGMDYHVLKEEEDIRISVCNFHDGKVFDAMRAFMFPGRINAAAVLVFVHNPIQSHDREDVGGLNRLEYELEHWLRSVASNLKSVARPGGGSEAKPRVMVVITNKDKLSAKLQTVYNLQELDVGTWLAMSPSSTIIHRVRTKFQDVVDVRELPYMVNVGDNEDARQLLDNMEIGLRGILKGLPSEPSICSKVATALQAKVSEQRTSIISTSEFERICLSNAEACSASQAEPDYSEEERSLLSMLRSTGDKGWRALAASLCEAGALLYHAKLSFIVIDLAWFGTCLLPHLIDMLPVAYAEPAADLKRSEDSAHVLSASLGNGFLAKKSLTCLLQNALSSVVRPGFNLNDVAVLDQLIQLMVLLDLCCKCEIAGATGDELHVAGDDQLQFLVPAILGLSGGSRGPDGAISHGRQTWEWRNWETQSRCIFVGRRYECQQLHPTVFSDGFFIRLQVALLKHAICSSWVEMSNSKLWTLQQNLFDVVVDGMEVVVEYSGLCGCFVDVLVKSSKSQQDTLEFVNNEILSTIRKLAEAECHQEVILSEAIIRPACLTARAGGPMPCIYRKHQAIAVETLEKKMNLQVLWSEVFDERGKQLLPSGWDKTNDLLKEFQAPVKDTVKDGQDDNCYPDANLAEGEKRGVAVIISMEECTPHPRRGGAVDRGRLYALVHSLGFEGITLLDQTREKLLQELQRIAGDIQENHKFFVCFVNAHGGTSEDGAHFIFDFEGGKVLLDEMLNPFRKCQQLIAKPKVVIVNACRGQNKAVGAEDHGSESLQPIGEKPWSVGTEFQYVRHSADWLVVFSTSAHFASLRNPAYGTAFIQALVEAFNNKRETTDLMRIMASVINTVVQKGQVPPQIGLEVKQCPVLVSTLSRLVYWPLQPERHEVPLGSLLRACSRCISA